MEKVEDVILNRRADATEHLVEYAEHFKGQKKEQDEDLAWRDEPLQQRLTHALVRGISTFIVEDTEAARVEIENKGGRPIQVIEGPLMEGWVSSVICLARVKCFCRKWLNPRVS